MKRVTFDQIARDEKAVTFQPDDSYLLSYREFIAYFAALDTITPHHLIIGAHFAYGWMPTILELKNPNARLARAVSILNEAKRGVMAGQDDLAHLAGLVNNSMVGASKLIHFVNPNLYAIWDSRVYRYINGQAPYQYQIGDPGNYLAYLANCCEIVADKRFKQLHISISAKVGYVVSPYRAVELVMFMNS